MKNVAHLLIAFLMFSLASCKEDPFVVPAGTVRLFINVNHHSTPIPNAVVFRKNGTIINPGTDTTLYDTRYVTDANGDLTLSDIGNGEQKLFLYAKGIDPSWDTTTVTPVSGYQYVIITTATGESKDVDLVIPVSE